MQTHSITGNIEKNIHRERAERYSYAFWFLVLFTFILYIAPQTIFPVLRQFQIPRLAAVGTIVFYVFGKKKDRFTLGSEMKLVLALVLLAIISIPFSLWPGGSLKTLTESYIKPVIIFFLIPHILISIGHLRKMLIFMIYFCLYAAVVTLKKSLTGSFSADDRITTSLGFILRNPNDLALALALILPFALCIYMTRPKSREKLISGIYVVLSIVTIMVTYSRGGFLILVTILGLFTLKMTKQKGAKVILPVILFSVILLYFAPSNYSDRLASIFNISKDTTGSSRSRKELTIEGFKIMLENPIIGVGLGANQLALNHRDIMWTEVHNVYLQIGADIGIPALLVFLLLLKKLRNNMRQIQQRLRHSREQRELYLWAMASELSLLGFAVSGLFYPIAYQFYFYYIAGFAVAINRISNATLKSHSSQENLYAH